MKFDIKKALKGAAVYTEDGYPVRLVCTDVRKVGGDRADFPVVGLVLRENGKEELHQYSPEGVAKDLTPGLVCKSDLTRWVLVEDRPSNRFTVLHAMHGTLQEARKDLQGEHGSMNLRIGKLTFKYDKEN